MTLIVPAGGTFSIGSNVQANSSTMNMSLDDAIANRRKESVKESRRGGRTRVSTADRTVAGGRAKRAAAVNARRNMTPTKKATKMEIEKEVKTQNARTQRAKNNQVKKKAGGRVAATGGRTARAAARAAGAAAAAKARQLAQTRTKQAAVQIQGRPPSKKAVNAAVQAFKANGFQIPQGTQMVIRFEGPNAPTNASPKAGAAGGRNAARAAGRAKATTNNNRNNNNTNTRNNNGRNNNNNNNTTTTTRRGGRGGGGRGRGRN